MRCAESCEYCAICDLQEQDVKNMASCTQINRACASVCWTSVQLMSTDNKFSKQFYSFCADICDACAKECERHTGMDHCQKCTEVCSGCAQKCRNMSNAIKFFMLFLVSKKYQYI
jgi:hypothetical protein